MDIALFVARLQAEVTGLREIEAAAGLDAAMRANRVAPAAYVIPLGERVEQMPFVSTTEHLESRVFGVIFVVETLDTTGAPAVLDLRVVRHQVKTALIGWVPDEETGEPVIFLGGVLVQFDGDGRMWWSDEYQFKSYWRK